MSSKILSTAVIGLECELVDVEADNSPHGTPGMFIVGLPDKAVDESRSRVRSAIKNSDLDFPRGNVTINLAPADLRKVGTYYDLPIALSCLAQAEQLSLEHIGRSVFVGELALDGTLRPVSGVLSIAMMCLKRGITTLYVPEENGYEAALVEGLTVYAPRNLKALIGHLRGLAPLEAVIADKLPFTASEGALAYDMMYVKGQEHAKRALEIAAAGSHNILVL